MIVDLYKLRMTLAELISEYGIAKSIINCQIEDIKEIKVNDNEVIALKEVKALKKKWQELKRKLVEAHTTPPKKPIFLYLNIFMDGIIEKGYTLHLILMQINSKRCSLKSLTFYVQNIDIRPRY